MVDLPVPVTPRPLRVAIVADLLEERWPSMDWVAELLTSELAEASAGAVVPTLIRPDRPLSRIRFGALSHRARILDRLVDRHVHYSRWLRGRLDDFDLVHIVDHSYAHLLRGVRPGRGVATCHDVDAFRCITAPDAEPRSAAFRRMTWRVLVGLRRAARVACDSGATRDALVAHGLVAPEKLVIVPLGVHAAFTSRSPNAGADARVGELLGPPAESAELLHVGSTIGRKRIDVLLRAFAECRAQLGDVRLIRVGGRMTDEQCRLASQLGISDSIVELTHLDPAVLAAVYRRAALVLLPSEREGFGLPVAEALACGTPALVSDLAVLREVGREAVAYAPSGVPQAWANAIVDLVTERRQDPVAWSQRRERALARGRAFEARQSARAVAEMYQELQASRRPIYGTTPPIAARAPGVLRQGGRLLRVTHVGKYYPPSFGGMETHLEGLCRGLVGRVDVEAIVAGHRRTTVREVIDGVPVTRSGVSATIASAPVCPGFVGALRARTPDILHLHHPNPSALAAYLVSGSPARVVVTYHADVTQQRVLNTLYAPVLRRVLDRATAIIVTSQEYADSSPVLPDHADKCIVVPLGVDVTPFASLHQPAVERIRADHGPQIILCVGRLVSYKGFEHLIRAMETVDARLLVIGDGPLRAWLEAVARASGVVEKVRFLGTVPDTAPYYAAADVYAMSSTQRSEAFGLVQVEAMAARVPVVNTAIPSGVPAVSLDGLTGLTVPPGDALALASALRTLLDDRRRAVIYGEAGHRRAADEFTLPDMIERTLAVYERVMSAPMPPLSPSIRA